MKILFLLLIASYTRADWTEGSEKIGSLLAAGVHYLSLTNCPIASEDLEKEKNKTIECLKNQISYHSLCSTVVDHFKPCVQDLLKEADRCKNPRAVQVRNALMDSFIEEAKFICSKSGEHIAEIGNTCVLRSVQRSHGCRNNLTSSIRGFDDLRPFCSVFPSLQKCLEDQMKHGCVKEMTRNTIHDFFSVTVNPCNMAMQMYLESVDLMVLD